MSLTFPTYQSIATICPTPTSFVQILRAALASKPLPPECLPVAAETANEMADFLVGRVEPFYLGKFVNWAWGELARAKTADDRLSFEYLARALGRAHGMAEFEAAATLAAKNNAELQRAVAAFTRAEDARKWDRPLEVSLLGDAAAAR